MFDLDTLLLGFSSIDLALFGLSMLAAELYTRTKVRMVVSFQVGLKKTKNNLNILGKKLRYDNSRSVLYVGKRMYNLHHWVVGVVLFGVSTILLNIHALSISAGLIVHNIIQNRKFPKFLT